MKKIIAVLIIALIPTMCFASQRPVSYSETKTTFNGEKENTTFWSDNYTYNKKGKIAKYVYKTKYTAMDGQKVSGNVTSKFKYKNGKVKNINITKKDNTGTEYIKVVKSGKKYVIKSKLKNKWSKIGTMKVKYDKKSRISTVSQKTNDKYFGNKAIKLSYDKSGRVKMVKLLQTTNGITETIRIEKFKYKNGDMTYRAMIIPQSQFSDMSEHGFIYKYGKNVTVTEYYGKEKAVSVYKADKGKGWAKGDDSNIHVSYICTDIPKQYEGDYDKAILTINKNDSNKKSKYKGEDYLTYILAA